MEPNPTPLKKKVTKGGNGEKNKRESCESTALGGGGGESVCVTAGSVSLFQLLTVDKVTSHVAATFCLHLDTSFSGFLNFPPSFTDET